MEKITCPDCGTGKISRNGKTDDGSRQRYVCRVCGRRFLEGTNDAMAAGERETMRAEIQSLKSQLKTAQVFAFQEDDFWSKLEKRLEYLSFDPVRIEEPINSMGGETIAMIGDVHFGALVDPKHTGGLGNYNTAIAKARLMHVLQEARNFDAMHHPGEAGVLNVFFLGDLFQGAIHDDNILEMSVLDSFVAFYEFLIAWVAEAKKHFAKIKIFGVAGNHGRRTQKIMFTRMVDDSFEYALYRLLQIAVSRIDGVEVTPAKALWQLVDVCGSQFLLAHGDMIRSTKSLSNNPDYGLTKNSMGMLKLAGHYDYYCIGHFHRPFKALNFLDMQMWINGSMIGGDHFSINCLGRATDPCQTLLYVTPEERVKTERVVWLQNIFEKA